MSDVFFTSDEHYNHANVIKFCKRPFASVEEMTEKLIANHNAKVGAGARVYHLGDMFWRTTKLAEAVNILDRLNGQHYYIMGNHDEVIEKSFALQQKFVWVKDLAEVKAFSSFPKIVLCHYSMRVWPSSHNGSWHLFGHSHGMLPDSHALSFDCGVDNTDYSPISIDEVSEIMGKRKAMGYGDPLEIKIKIDPWDKSADSVSGKPSVSKTETVGSIPASVANFDWTIDKTLDR